MQTIKTAIVVVLLLVVFYGVYEMLNRPPAPVPAAIQDLPDEALADVQVDLGLPEVSMPGIDSLTAGAGTGELPGNESQFSDFAGPPGGSVPSVSPSTGGLYLPPTVPPTGAPSAAAAGETTSADSRADVTRVDAAVPRAETRHVPVADSEVYVTPSGPQMQLNPHVDEEPVPKPEVARNESSQMGAVLFKQALAKAQSLVAEEEYVAALRTLSVFYKSPDLTEQQHRELLDLLDPLAGRVIYSREHLLTRPCTVGRGQTLADIAQQYNVPAQLLQKINGIESPNVLLPGSELKVVPGPFHADVDLVGQELTLFVDGLYAGRFPVSLGTDPQPKEGEFHVREKQLGKTYFALDGRTVPAESPNNPFGRVWMDLGREVCIHGSPASGSDSQHGCISLSPRDAEDVYSILSVGSKVRILR